MITMGRLQQTALTVLIGFVFLSLPEPFFALKYRRNHAMCKYVFKNVCFDFVGGSYNWSEARRICEHQGGELLKVMNSQLKLFLKNIHQVSKTTDSSWWLGEGLQGELMVGENGDFLSDTCSYVKLNPLQLFTSSDCGQRRGFLCIHRFDYTSDKKRSTHWSQTTGSRHKREAYLDILDGVEKTLRQIEQEIGAPTSTNRTNLIASLLKAATALTTPTNNNHTINRILNCSTAIITLSMQRCDVATNPNPTSLFEDVFKILRVISVLLGKDTSELFVLNHPQGTLYQQSYKPDALGHAMLGSKENGEYVIMPSKKAMQSFLTGGANVLAQLATFRSNPHPSHENISGYVFSVMLSNSNTDKEISVHGLSEMFELFLPRPNVSALANSSVLLKENRKALTSFNVTDTNMTVFMTIEPNVSVSLILTLSHGSPPNSSFNGSKTILNREVGYRWMITPEMLDHTLGTWYIDARLYNSTWVPGLTLSITTYKTKCLYWDGGREMWTTAGCHVGVKSTPELTHCLCNHLTLFGSSFFVMPNYVDVSRTTELFATASKNYVVLSLLCAFFGLYLMTLLWAIYADRKASSKRKITLLEDNHPGAQYNYLICVHTGHRKNAGTTANVTLKLIGTEGESDIHNLTDPDKPVFERGSVDMFLLATPFPLGEVKNIRLQHDNSGGRPSWYISRVTIQDLQNRGVFHFLCDCWLSSDRGDGMTKKTFNAAKSNEITSFRNIFQNRTSIGFRDEHIWMSVVDPPSRSPFTRAQRISCCMCLLLCTMAINIAFWNLPVDENSPVVLSIGILKLTWQEIMVGIQSGLLMFPINILIITIFRSIKPRMVSKKDNEEEIVKPPPVSIPTILKETEEVITMLSQNQRNKISLSNRLESSSDLCPALENVHEFIQMMQGDNVSDTHWVYCSKFILCGLCHLLLSLEKLDVKNFPSTYEYQHVLSTTNLLVRKAEMVFTSHLAYCPAPVKVKKKKRTPTCWLPWWCVFLGWFLLLSISGVSTFFTLLYGFEYGKDKSIKWVMSLGLSLFQSIFVLQPLKVVGIAVFFALLLKPVAVEETEEVEQVLLSQKDKCRCYTGRDV